MKNQYESIGVSFVLTRTAVLPYWKAGRDRLNFKTLQTLKHSERSKKISRRCALLTWSSYFWQYLSILLVTSYVTLKCSIYNYFCLQKDRMLKDQIRSGNCILKKLKKCREDDAEDQVLIFFSQVDMKLVSRVLNMQRLTADQLAWCRNKLNTISFVNRKIHVEPSFCLFPC